MRIHYTVDPRIYFDDPEEILRQPKLILVNEFDEESLEEFEETMDEAHLSGQPVIPVIIDSYGGSVYGLNGFVAAIESARRPVATVITSKAMSAGALLFCFGTDGYRYMHPHATMMIHDVSTLSYGKIEEVKVDARHTEHLNRSIYRRASQHLGHPPNYLAELIRSKHHVDWFLTAKQAQKHNIANHLTVPTFEVKISLEYDFG